MPYGEVSPSHRERFLPGSLEPVDDVWLDLGHDRSRVLTWKGAGLELIDGPEALRMRATLPRNPLADMALEDVASGKRKGLSVEFTASRETREAQTGIRVVESGKMYGIGLVPKPSYPSASVSEIRQAGRLSGAFPIGVELPCRCRADCETALFEPGSLDRALREAANGDREINLFFSGDYSNPISSVGRGLELNLDGDTLNIRSQLPETDAVRNFLTARDNAFYSVRLWVPATSVYTKRGTTAVFGEDTDLRGVEIAVITGPTDNYDELEIIEDRKAPPIWL